MSKMKTDNQGRPKCKQVSLHMSPEEFLLLDKYVSISGLTKRAYIEERILLPYVKVYGNPRVYKALREQMGEIVQELKRIEKSGDLTQDFISLMKFTMNIYDGMKEESNEI